MNAIIGMAELALREKTPDAIHEHVLTVKQAGANLLAIINDILDFSKIESGTLAILPAPYLFSSLINDVISIIRMRVLDKQIKFTVNIDCNIPNALIGDEVRIRQVLINVLGNAVKYTEKGFVSFKVCEESTENDTINLLMEIADSGRGIKSEDLDTLFGEYVQVDMGRNKSIEGVGLGLAITQSIAREMGGSISVESEYGVGSTFTIRLPQKVHSPEKLAAVDDPEKIKVLVYERRKTYSDSIANTVGNLGVDCVLAETDAELRELMSGNGFSHVFLSYELYGKNEDTIRKLAGNAKIVLLAEFSESIPDKSMSTLPMPAHSMSVASVLNGTFDNYFYYETDEAATRFVAPDAKVLIVDDIGANLVVAKGLLAPYRMSVDLCKSGEEAIEAIRAERYDLVFMDHRMPGMDGIEATKIIRGMGGDDPYIDNLPIIALTANAISGTREMFLRSGFNDYLSKPIDILKLSAVLERWLPRELQRSPSEIAPATQNGGQSVAYDGLVIEIEGADVSRGIAISGGTASLYLATLAAFYQDGQEKLGTIGDCIETGDLDLFRIHVHGMKSALFSIGAEPLSEAAKALEMAAASGDVDFIRSNNAAFLSSLESLLGQIESCLSKIAESEGAASGNPDKDRFKEELELLKQALSSMDRSAMNKALTNLQDSAPTGEYAAAVKGISNNIIVADYDEAEEQVESLLSQME